MQSFKVSASFEFCTTEEAGSHKYIFPKPTLKLMMKLGFCVHGGIGWYLVLHIELSDAFAQQERYSKTNNTYIVLTMSD